MTDPTLRRLRPSLVRSDRDGWEGYSVGQFAYRYDEGARHVDVPIERGLRADGRATIELYPEELTWRGEDGSAVPLTAEETEMVVDRLRAGLLVLDVVPIVREP